MPSIFFRLSLPPILISFDLNALFVPDKPAHFAEGMLKCFVPDQASHAQCGIAFAGPALWQMMASSVIQFRRNLRMALLFLR